MAFLEPLRRGAEELIDTLGEGWDWLRDRSASALTRFRHTPQDEEGLPTRRTGDSWGLLASEIATTDDEIIVRIEAPGLDERDVSVEVEADQLVVRGRKRFEREDRGARYVLFEAAYGAFERRFGLPCRVDGDRAKARYRKGVLTVRLPRVESERARRVRVEAA